MLLGDVIARLTDETTAAEAMEWPAVQLFMDRAVANGWRDQPIPEPEALYDLVFDPTERNNLAHDPAHRATLKEMRTRLAAWMKRTDDPLLKGPIPLPVGYITTNPDAVSPDDIEKPAQDASKADREDTKE